MAIIYTTKIAALSKSSSREGFSKDASSLVVSASGSSKIRFTSFLGGNSKDRVSAGFYYIALAKWINFTVIPMIKNTPVSEEFTTRMHSEHKFRDNIQTNTMAVCRIDGTIYLTLSQKGQPDQNFPFGDITGTTVSTNGREVPANTAEESNNAAITWLNLLLDLSKKCFIVHESKNMVEWDPDAPTSMSGGNNYP